MARNMRRVLIIPSLSLISPTNGALALDTSPGSPWSNCQKAALDELIQKAPKGMWKSIHDKMKQ
jgi:hypothetical protein